MALAFGLHSLGGVGTLAGGVIPGTIGATTFLSSLGGAQTRVYGSAQDTTSGVGFDTGSASILIRLASQEAWRFSGATGALTGTAGFGVTTTGTGTFGNVSVTGAQLIARSASFTQFSLGTAGNAVFNVDVNGLTTCQMGSSNGNTGIVPCVANVNTTSTASGAGASDLITYTLLANSLTINGKGLRIKAWGTTANNANAKTVALLFGGTTLVTKQLTVSIAGFWEIEAVVFRTGASAQTFEAKATNSGGTTVSSTDGATVLMQMNVSTAAETDTAGIIIKGRATAATAASDIVQKGMFVEFFN